MICVLDFHKTTAAAGSYLYRFHSNIRRISSLRTA